jgi:hypothetical protein
MSDAQSESAVETAPVESAPEAAQTQDPAPAVDSASAPPAQMPWQPDFKVKVKDQEFEVDDFLRPALSDEEKLKKVKRLYEQAHGLPEVSKARDEWKQKFETVQPKVQEYQQVQSNLNRLSHFVQNKDFDSFFEATQIPVQEVYQWVKAKIEQQNLPPQVQQQLEQARVAQQKAFDYEQRIQQFETQTQEQQRAQQYQMLSDGISTYAKDVATQFNERIGDPNAFQNAVINKGIAIQQTTGQKAPVSEVIAMVAADLQRVMGIQAQAAQAQQAASQPQMQGNAQPKPVIPAMKAGGASPTQQSPRSIADLKKIAASL